MAEVKILDERHTTRGGVIRLEVWIDSKTKALIRYNMAYINHHLFARDNGRVVGFDNAHAYPGFASHHHYHWFGRVVENKKFVSVDDALQRFQRYLKPIRHILKKDF
jgi:predicted GNAT superfamily acetyltransferase